MFKKLHLFGVLIFSFTFLNCQTSTNIEEPKITFKVSKTDKEWKEFKLKTIEQRIRKNNAEVRLHTYFKKNRTRKNK